jgi:hypothetical protein
MWNDHSPDRSRFWPRSFAHEPDDVPPVTVLNEPIPPANVTAMPARHRSLHAVLVESLNSAQALLARLERGVHVPRAEQREAIRLLYVGARHQRDVLAACLELDGLE